MKTLNIQVCKIILLILTGFCFSCQKFQPNSVLEKSPATSANENTDYPLTTIFTASEHTFTDVQICYDDKIFLLEGGRLKRLIGSQLEEVQLPASVYTDFDPKYLAISKDFTFYLRAANGIKVIKNKQLIHYYKVGAPPLQDFTEQTFGNWEIGVDETDQSILFGIERLQFDSVTFALAKITKDGHFGKIPTNVYMDLAEFITTFGIGGTPGVLWVSGIGDFNGNIYSVLFKYALTTPPTGYQGIKTYGRSPTNHNSPPSEGPIDSVSFSVLADIAVSKDGKNLYLKTGRYRGFDNPNPGIISNTGEILRIIDNQVKIIARKVENKRLAISNDGKTLYIAGNGLTKIDF
jgi:hypothetical protein